MQTDQQKIGQLVERLNKYAYDYYVLDKPTISDKEYDALYDQLVELEEQTGLILPHSPTQRVGDTVIDKFKRVNHKVRLYSLNKAQNLAQLEKWYNDIKKVYPEAEFTVSYKFDGLTIVCEYENGFFKGAYTRGNGLVGEDVTAQVKTIASVPLSIPYKGNLLVHGEGIITFANLEKYNKTAKEKLKNARNAASGGIRNLDPKATRQRNLDVIFYNVLLKQDEGINSQTDMQNFLQNQGFYVSPFFARATTFQQIVETVNHIDEQKNKIDFLIDGVVISVDSVSQRNTFGHTAKFPRWSIAYKFEAMETSSILKQVVWQVGRTGKLTPIAIVEPVVLAGATVQRATLNNIEDINKKNLLVPSRVFIRRSNEVIPEILSLAEKFENSKPILPPEECPSCGGGLVYKNMNLYCKNFSKCGQQVVEKLVHFASKDGMDIEGLSRQTLLALLQNLNITKPYQLYTITKEQLLTLEGFKNKKASNIINAIKNSKKVKLANFIYALGILNVGTKSARDLAKHFKTYENFKNASFEHLLQVKDIGEITAQTIVNFFEDENNQKVLDQLFKVGVEVENAVQDGKMPKTMFYEKVVVLTGSFENLTRAQATQLLQQYGATVTGSVSKNTDYVIYGKEAGSKKTKAEQLGVKTLEQSQVFGKIIKLQA